MLRSFWECSQGAVASQMLFANRSCSQRSRSFYLVSTGMCLWQIYTFFSTDFLSEDLCHLLKRLWSKQSFQKMFICTPRLKKWNVIRGVGRRKLVIILFSKAELATKLKDIVSDYRTVQNTWATPHFFVVCFQSALLKWFHFHFSPCLWPFSGFYLPCRSFEHKKHLTQGMSQCFIST